MSTAGDRNKKKKQDTHKSTLNDRSEEEEAKRLRNEERQNELVKQMRIDIERKLVLLRPHIEEEKQTQEQFSHLLQPMSLNLALAFDLWKNNRDHYHPPYDRYLEWIEYALDNNNNNHYTEIRKYFIRHFSQVQSKASFPQLYRLIYEARGVARSIKQVLQTRMNELYPDYIRSMEYSKQVAETISSRYINQWLGDEYDRVVRDPNAIHHINEAILAAPKSTRDFLVFRGSKSRSSSQDVIALSTYNHYKFFGGTSLDLAVASGYRGGGKVVYVIKVLTGTPFLYYPNNQFEEEYEVLLPPNWHFTAWIPSTDTFHPSDYSFIVDDKRLTFVEFHYSVTNREQESNWMYQQDISRYGLPAKHRALQEERERRRIQEMDDDSDSDDGMYDTGGPGVKRPLRKYVSYGLKW